MTVPEGFERVEGAGAFADTAGPFHHRDGVFGLRIEGRHLNRADTAHGGLMATLVDFALASAIAEHDSEDRRYATVSLTTDYIGAVDEGDWLEAHTKVDRVGGSLAFADCSLRVGDAEKVRARAVFAVTGS